MRVFALAALVLGCLLAGPAVGTAGADYQNLFHVADPFAASHPDPCDSAGPSGGLIVKNNVKPSGDFKGTVNIALLCGPVVTYPSTFFPSTLLWDDAVWQRYLDKSGSPDAAKVGHALEAGREGLFWNSGISTIQFPFLKGPDGTAPAMAAMLTAPAFKEFLKRIKDSFPAISVSSLVPCALSLAWAGIGSLVTGGTLLPVGFALIAATCGVGSASLFGLLAITAKDLIGALFADAWNRLFSRADIMDKTDWFAWSNQYGGWNSYGDISGNTINPSLSSGSINGKAKVRVGVAIVNAATNQGADFRNATAGGGGAKSADLAKLDVLALLTGGRIRETPEGVVRGTPGNDVIHARPGHVTINGGPGNDVIYGGRGEDTIFGGGGRDVIYGGRGNDVIFGGDGRDVIYAGRNYNWVDVADRHPGDRVDCRGSRLTTVLADRGDNIAPNCFAGRSRVFIDGRRVRRPAFSARR